MTIQSIHPTSTLMGAERAARAGAVERAGGVRGRDHHRGRIEFRVIFAIAFLFFLIASALERAIPRWSAPSHDPGVRKSVLERAKESASIAAGYAFMG